MHIVLDEERYKEGTLIRIPEMTTNRKHTSTLFDYLGAEFYNKLLLSPPESIEVVGEFYTTKRVSLDTDLDVSNRLIMMPEDIQLLWKESKSIGEIELDILDFMFNIRGNMVLTIRGHRGIGKSTLLQYVMFHLTKQLDSMKEFFPIYVDFLSEKSKLNSKVIKEKIIDAYKLSQKMFDIPIESPFSSFIDDLEKKDNSNICNMTVQSCRSLPKLFDHKIKPIYIFDNVDQLHPETVDEILSLSRHLSLNCRVPIIISMRPSTYRTEAELGDWKGTFVGFVAEVQPPDLHAIIEKRLELLSEDIADLTSKLPSFLERMGRPSLEVKKPEQLFLLYSEYLLDSLIQLHRSSVKTINPP